MLSKLSFSGMVRVAVPVVAILCLNSNDGIEAPSMVASFEPTYQCRQWEDSCFNDLPYKLVQSDELLEDIDTIQSFIANLIQNSQDLKPEVVELVSRRYKDLI